MPAGFRLVGVWLFQPNHQSDERNSVLLHYTNGLNTLSLFERMRKPAGAGPMPAHTVHLSHRSIQRWPITTPAGVVEVTCIGTLTPAELQALHYFLR